MRKVHRAYDYLNPALIGIPKPATPTHTAILLWHAQGRLNTIGGPRLDSNWGSLFYRLFAKRNFFWFL